MGVTQTKKGAIINEETLNCLNHDAIRNLIILAFYARNTSILTYEEYNFTNQYLT